MGSSPLNRRTTPLVTWQWYEAFPSLTGERHRDCCLKLSATHLYDFHFVLNLIHSKLFEILLYFPTHLPLLYLQVCLSSPPEHAQCRVVLLANDFLHVVHLYAKTLCC